MVPSNRRELKAINFCILRSKFRRIDDTNSLALTVPTFNIGLGIVRTSILVQHAQKVQMTRNRFENVGCGYDGHPSLNLVVLKSC
jgi:hypothetical protein